MRTFHTQPRNTAAIHRRSLQHHMHPLTLLQRLKHPQQMGSHLHRSMSHRKQKTKNGKNSRQATRPASNPMEKNPLHIEHALQSGWTAKDMGGSGDCFFRAWIKAENAYHNKSQSEQEVTNAALQLRLEATKYIRKHEQHYQELWRNDTMEKQCPRAGQPAPKKFEDFLKQASKKNYWVPHPSSCHPHWYPGSYMACLPRQGSQQPEKTLASGRLGSKLSKWGRQSNRHMWGAYPHRLQVANISNYNKSWKLQDTPPILQGGVAPHRNHTPLPILVIRSHKTAGGQAPRQLHETRLATSQRGRHIDQANIQRQTQRSHIAGHAQIGSLGILRTRNKPRQQTGRKQTEKHSHTKQCKQKQ